MAGRQQNDRYYATSGGLNLAVDKLAGKRGFQMNLSTRIATIMLIFAGRHQEKDNFNMLFNV